MRDPRFSRNVTRPKDDAPIRAVLFDAVGTLFHSRGTIGAIYSTLAREHGLSVGADQIQERFLYHWQLGPPPIDQTGWRELVQSVFEGLGPFPKFNAFFEQLYDVFRTSRAWLCYPETSDVLRRLDQRHYPMGVVSNFDSRLSSVLKALEISPFFKTVITPASSGYLKPDSRIFWTATQALGVKPNETMFVGDDPVEDIEGAASAGLRAVLIDRSRPRPGSRVALDSLEEVLRLLGCEPAAAGDSELECQ